MNFSGKKFGFVGYFSYNRSGGIPGGTVGGKRLALLERRQRNLFAGDECAVESVFDLSPQDGRFFRSQAVADGDLEIRSVVSHVGRYARI